MAGTPSPVTAYDLADFNAEYRQAELDLLEGLGDVELSEAIIQERAVRAHRARINLATAKAEARRQ